MSLRDYATVLWNCAGYAGVASSLVFMGNVFAAEIFGYMGQWCNGDIMHPFCTNQVTYIEPNIYIKIGELIFVLWLGIFMLFKLKKWGVGVKLE